MWRKDPDGSFLDSNNRVLWFSLERFVRDICLGHCCFICGASPDSVAFNDEHVIPEWILRRFNLFDDSITLPNGVRRRYDRYKVPCCAACNSLMGAVVETAISEACRDGINSLVPFVSSGNALKLFVWMGLLFLKTHLKDREFRFNVDSRAGGDKIGDIYEWSSLHHIHSLARCFYTDAIVTPEAIGSMMVVEAQDHGGSDTFDYCDLYSPQASAVKLGNVAVIAVMDDSQGALSYFQSRLEKCTGPLSRIQIREIMVECGFLNLHLKNRPEFATQCDMGREEMRIVAFRPQLELLQPMDYCLRGEMLHYALKPFIPRIQMPGHTAEQIETAVKAGKATFLVDENGQFVTHAFAPLDE